MALRLMPTASAIWCDVTRPSSDIMKRMASRVRCPSFLSTFSVHLGQLRFHPGLRSSAIADDVGEGAAVGGGSGRGGWIAHGDEGDGFERGG